MKKIIALVASSLLAISSVALANETGAEHKTETDTSKNPITGTVTTTKKTTHKKKGIHGEGTHTMEAKTKVSKDGKKTTTETTEKTESELH